MSTKQLSQWRTVGVVVFACLLLLAAFLVVVVLATPDAKDAFLDVEKARVDRLFEALTEAVVWLVVAVAAKAGVEHLGKGRGLGGAKAAFLTEATPDDPVPAQPPPSPGAQP